LALKNILTFFQPILASLVGRRRAIWEWFSRVARAVPYSTDNDERKHSF